jgi:hypothetical protein
MNECFPTTAVFELPCLSHALELLEELQTVNWTGWVENGLDGVFVVISAPERSTELQALTSHVGRWLDGRHYLAIRFHLEGRRYIMQRGGLVEPAPDGSS